MSSKDEAPGEAMQRLRIKLQVKSAEIAIDALTQVAGDRNAPAPARATAGTSLLRAAGFFERGEAGTGNKEPHQMTAEELDKAIKRLKSDATALAEPVAEPSGVFD